MTAPSLLVHDRGKYLSEGSRLLWAAMCRDSLKLAVLSRELDVAYGIIGRWLRGQQRPNGKFRASLHERFAIPMTAWDRPPQRAFLPGHAA